MPTSAWQNNTRIVHNTAGSVVREELPDGTVFTWFDGQQRPVEGTVAGQDGGPAQSVDIAYDTGVVYTRSLQDKSRLFPYTTLFRSREELPDGTVFTGFDGQQRPVEGTVAGQ